MGEGMSKVLVVYWTGTGCTEGVAKRIAATLADQGMEVDVKTFRSAPDTSGYDAVVAGSGTRAGSWHAAAKRWMTGNAVALKEKPLAIFTVCMALSEGPENTEEALGYTDKLLAKTGLEPLGRGVFAGWYEPQKFNWLERQIMKMKKAKEGDFRDWEAIENWAAGLVPSLKSVA